MTPEQIETARLDGRLDRVLGVPDHVIALAAKARTERIDAADVRALAALGRHDLIEAARTDDRIDYPNQEN
jgi:hypothetical protein